MYHNVPRAIIICIRIRIPPVLLKPKQILINFGKTSINTSSNKLPDKILPAKYYKDKIWKLKIWPAKRSEILKQLKFQNFIFKIMKIQQLEIYFLTWAISKT